MGANDPTSQSVLVLGIGRPSTEKEALLQQTLQIT